MIIIDLINIKICNHPCRLKSVTEPHYQFFVCNHKKFPYDYRKKIDNVTQLQIIDDKKQITGKKSVITACNVDYRLKRSGPILAKM